MDTRMVEQFQDEDDFLVEVNFQNKEGIFEVTFLYWNKQTEELKSWKKSEERPAKIECWIARYRIHQIYDTEEESLRSDGVVND